MTTTGVQCAPAHRSSNFGPINAHSVETHRLQISFIHIGGSQTHAKLVLYRLVMYGLATTQNIQTETEAEAKAKEVWAASKDSNVMTSDWKTLPIRLRTN